MKVIEIPHPSGNRYNWKLFIEPALRWFEKVHALELPPLVLYPLSPTRLGSNYSSPPKMAVYVISNEDNPLALPTPHVLVLLKIFAINPVAAQIETVFHEYEHHRLRLGRVTESEVRSTWEGKRIFVESVKVLKDSGYADGQVVEEKFVRALAIRDLDAYTATLKKYVAGRDQYPKDSTSLEFGELTDKELKTLLDALKQ